MSSYQRGLLLVTLSAVIWSTVGLFAKGIAADVWVILFWRGLFSILALGVYIWIKSQSGFVQEFRELGWPGWVSAIVGGVATVCFISAFKYTSIANVSIMYAIVPFIVAILAWLLIREKASPITLIAAGIALIGVCTMVSGSFGSTNLKGDLLAVGMAIGMAALVVIFRMYPNRPMILSTVLSAIMHVILSFFLSNPLDVTFFDLGLLVGFGVTFAAATICMIEGTRLIPASRSALISTAETPLGPIWAWLIFAQFPVIQTWIGGGLVLAAVTWNLVADKHHE
jgi:drug/metabolite transporter (DMT)-like permease